MSRRAHLPRFVLAMAIGLLGCRHRGVGAESASPDSGLSPLEVSGALSRPSLRTTDGEIAVHNLQAELTQAERQHEERPSDLGRSRALVDLLLTRAKFLGRLADYDRAETLASHAVRLAPESGDAHLLRARVLATLHEFDAALAALDRAGKLGANNLGVRQLRAAVWQATGRTDEALVLFRGWRRDHPDLGAWAAEASVISDQRNWTAASAAFAHARDAYADVSPFPVAWLEFQEGHMWESAGRSDRARPLFESAVARLPAYAAAASHLARLRAAFGDPQGLREAAALLEPLVTRSDDPEYLGQLGALYKRMGRGAAGDALIRCAADGYESLLKRHPEAFFDHASRFWLHVANDPQRALTLARSNLALRSTADARDLDADAERAVAAR